MSLTRASGPVVDVGLDVVRVAVTGRYPLGARLTTDKGEEAILCQANGAIPIAGLVGITGTPFDAQALTTAIVNALSVSDRRALEIGFSGAETAVADNEIFWMIRSKPDSAETDFGAIYSAAAVAAAQMATTAVAGEIDDAAPTGSFDLIGFTQVGTVSGSGLDTDNRWTDLRLDPTANA